MNKIEQYYHSIVDDWCNTYKGKATINFGPKISPLPVCLEILYNVFTKDDTRRVVIITEDDDARSQFFDYITHTSDTQNNNAFRELIKKKNIVVTTINFAKGWYSRDNWFLCITIGINDYKLAVDRFVRGSKFCLICLTADTNTSNIYYDIASNMVSNALDSLKRCDLCPPVEEYQIPIAIDDSDELALLKKYDDFIRESLSIFGEFSNIGLALYGDPKVNVSSIEYCTILAKNNGWSETLDISIPYNKEIDRYFNPTAIQERAKIFFDIKSKRMNLVACNKSKLNKILEICKDNKDKKILIISKNTAFAKEITDYLNSKLEHYCNGHRFFDPCYNYHEDVEPIYDMDIYGNVKVVKSGVNKGEKRIIKGAAQMTAALDYYNLDYTNILSCGNAPNPNLNCHVDILIITSALCETIKSYLYRLGCLSFNTNKILAYKLYCMNTFEVTKLSNEIPTDNHTIVNLCENSCEIEKNNDNFIVI